MCQNWMNRCNRWVVAAVVSGGLSGTAALLTTSPALQASAQWLAEEHFKHPHMHHALESLRDARHELESAEDVFKGHRDEALDHVDHAIKQIQIGLKEQSDEAAAPSDASTRRTLDGERFPHMRRALESLHAARTELEAADKVFAGHRDEAIDHTAKAIKQLEEALH